MSGRTYVVTGVSGGIGAALAGVLKARGDVVIGLDIAKPHLDLDQFIALDLSDPVRVAGAVAQISGAIDGLCNSAGLPPRPGLAAKILEVNFEGTRALARALRDQIQEGGSVVNLASRAGHGWRENVDQVKRLAVAQDMARFVAEEGIDPTRAYDLSKEAVILWTMAASESFANKGLRINSVSPGAVDTAIMSDFETAFGDRMIRNVARAGRAGQPLEIAHLAAFLLSPESHWIKGTDISIDGGMSAFNAADTMGLSGLV